MSVETRNGVLFKLGVFGCAAIGLFIVGKRHIAAYKEERHRTETDARVDSEENEFGILAKRPGFPANNPTLNYEGQRGSRFQGSGLSYHTRTPGDRLSMFAIFDRKWGSDKDK